MKTVVICGTFRSALHKILALKETIYARSETEIMRNEYDKCYFCKSYDEYEGCEWGCEDKKGFEPNHDRIIAKAKEKDISVADIIALINM